LPPSGGGFARTAPELAMTESSTSPLAAPDRQRLFGNRRALVVAGTLLLLLVGGWLAHGRNPLEAVIGAPGIGALAAVVIVLVAPWFAPRGCSTMSWRELVVWAVAFGIGASLAQNLLRVAGYFLWFRPLPVSFTDYFVTLPSVMWWLTPLGEVAMFLALALWVKLAGRALSGIDQRALALALFAFVAVLDTVGYVLGDRLYPISLVIVSLGVATMISRRWQRLPARVPIRIAIGATAICLLLAIGGRWASRPAPPPDNPPLGPPNGNARPNIVLVTLDTVRKHNLSLYGYHRDTSPALARLAARGVTFRQAYAPCSWTLPTHASLFTGEMPHTHGATIFDPLPESAWTLAEALREAGYATGAFVGNCSYCSARTGLGQGFARYEDLPITRRTLLKTSYVGGALCAVLLNQQSYDPRMSAAEVNARFLHWQRQQTGRPFFAFVNYYDAHFPYYVPDPRFDRYTTLKDPQARWDMLWRWVAQLPDWRPTQPDEIEYAIGAYDGIVRYVDHQLGAMLDELQQRGALDNTIVVVTNDHGEHFGERGHWLHGATLYRPVIEAPLVISYPAKAPAGRMLERPVSLADVPATILDLAGITPSRPLPGVSWALGWSDEAPQPVFAEVLSADRNFAHLKSVIADGYHYIQADDGAPDELYRLEDGFAEATNLAETPAGRRLLPRFRALVSAEFTAQPQTAQRRRGAVWPLVWGACCR